MAITTIGLLYATKCNSVDKITACDRRTGREIGFAVADENIINTIEWYIRIGVEKRRLGSLFVLLLVSHFITIKYHSNCHKVLFPVPVISHLKL